MNVLNHRIMLDMLTLTSQVTVHIKKNDTKNKLVISLSANNKMYEMEKDIYAAFVGKKPDGKIVFNECEVVGNTIEYTVTAQTSAVVGIVACEIRLYDGDNNLLTSPKFNIVVDETLYDSDDIESENEINVLDALISEAQAFLRSAKSIVRTYIDEGGHLVIEYTDGSSETLGQVVGANGDKGEKGADGKDGKDGINGTDGKDGADGVDGRDGYSILHFTTDEMTYTDAGNGNYLFQQSVVTSKYGRRAQVGDLLLVGTTLYKVRVADVASSVIACVLVADLKGPGYVITEADYVKIAEQAAALVDTALLSIIGEVSE